MQIRGFTGLSGGDHDCDFDPEYYQCGNGFVDRGRCSYSLVVVVWLHDVC